MAHEELLRSISKDAGADLSTSQYKILQLNSSGEVTRQTTAGGAAIGVLQNKPTKGTAATVGVIGVTKVLASGLSTAIAYFDPIQASTIATAKKAGSADFIIGRALESVSTGTTKVIPMLLTYEGTF